MRPVYLALLLRLSQAWQVISIRYHPIESIPFNENSIFQGMSENQWNRLINWWASWTKKTQTTWKVGLNKQIRGSNKQNMNYKKLHTQTEAIWNRIPKVKWVKASKWCQSKSLEVGQESQSGPLCLCIFLFAINNFNSGSQLTIMDRLLCDPGW